MKRKGIFLWTMVSLAGCKLAEDNKTGEKVRLRYDGVYIADNTSAKPITGLTNGQEIPGRKAIFLLRFYDPGAGVIVPESTDTSNHFTNDSLVNRYYSWCKEFETKNPKDKEFVNIQYRIVNDSLMFEQQGENMSLKWSGRITGDTLILRKSIYPGGNTAHPVNTQYRFTFYPYKKEE